MMGGRINQNQFGIRMCSYPDDILIVNCQAIACAQPDAIYLYGSNRRHQIAISVRIRKLIFNCFTRSNCGT